MRRQQPSPIINTNSTKEEVLNFIRHRRAVVFDAERNLPNVHVDVRHASLRNWIKDSVPVQQHIDVVSATLEHILYAVDQLIADVDAADEPTSSIASLVKIITQTVADGALESAAFMSWYSTTNDPCGLEAITLEESLDEFSFKVFLKIEGLSLLTEWLEQWKKQPTIQGWRPQKREPSPADEIKRRYALDCLTSTMIHLSGEVTIGLCFPLSEPIPSSALSPLLDDCESMQVVVSVKQELRNWWFEFTTSPEQVQSLIALR